MAQNNYIYRQKKIANFSFCSFQFQNHASRAVRKMNRNVHKIQNNQHRNNAPITVLRFHVTCVSSVVGIRWLILFFFFWTNFIVLLNKITNFCIDILDGITLRGCTDEIDQGVVEKCKNESDNCSLCKNFEGNTGCNKQVCNYYLQ